MQNWLVRSNPTYSDSFLVGDFNGDGRQDLFRREGGNSLAVSLSTGSGFTTTQWATFAGEWADVRVGDFDGDGRDDLAGRMDGFWSVFLSDGTKFTRSSWDYWVEGGWSDVRVADFDGDGRDDIAGRRYGNWWVGLSNGTSFKHSFWGQWRPAFQMITAVDTTGQPASAAPVTGGGPPSGGGLSIDDGGSLTKIVELPRGTFSPVTVAPARTEPLQLFWSQAERDEEFAGRLLATA